MRACRFGVSQGAKGLTLRGRPPHTPPPYVTRPPHRTLRASPVMSILAASAVSLITVTSGGEAARGRWRGRGRAVTRTGRWRLSSPPPPPARTASVSLASCTASSPGPAPSSCSRRGRSPQHHPFLHQQQQPPLPLLATSGESMALAGALILRLLPAPSARPLPLLREGAHAQPLQQSTPDAA